MIDGMTWNNGTGFVLVDGTLTPKDPWIDEGETVGLIRTARNLTYILFYNTSHAVTYNYSRQSRVMLHQFMQLNTEQTTKKNIEGTTQTTHHAYKLVGYIALVIFITGIVLTGIISIFAHKRQPSGLPTPFTIIRVLKSKNHGVEGQPSVVYSPLYDSNERLHVSDTATLV